MHYITAVRLVGGESERHISHVRWLNTLTGVTKSTPVSGMVEWLEKGHVAMVGGESGPVRVVVVHPSGGKPFLRTVADDNSTDNLLRLPRY